MIMSLQSLHTYQTQGLNPEKNLGLDPEKKDLESQTFSLVLPGAEEGESLCKELTPFPGRGEDLEETSLGE